MIIAILALLGVPLWLCAILILVIVVRNRKLRKRHGNIPVRVKHPGKERWTRGHAIWVSDVFAWRGSPGVWNEDLVHVMARRCGTPTLRNGRSCATWGTASRSRRYLSRRVKPWR
jgi:hypothetical protein